MKYQVKDYPEIKQKVKNMDVTDLIRAVICPDIRVGQQPPRNTGTVFLHPATVDEANAFSAQINSERENKALIVADMEYGAGGAIIGAVSFPSMRAVKEAGDSKFAYEMGVIAAKEAISAGYHWTFGPCVDILGNRMNPIVQLRTAGENAGDVIAFCGAYMRGLQDTGLIATLKHFPGDGYSFDDQHVTTTENPLSREDWDASFGRVYRELIEAGAMSIMPGHIALPAYDEADENGLYPPATVSKNLLTGLLRDKLGFEGIIVSDATEMAGFCGYMNFYHACAAFLEAGGDCLLFVHESDELFREMGECIAQGRLTLQTLRNRAYRMLCFAREYFESHRTQQSVDFDRAAAEALAKEISRSAVKVIRDRKNLLPIKIEGKRIAHVVVHNDWCTDFSQVEGLTAQLRITASSVEEIRDPGPAKLEIMAKSGEYDLIICSILEAPAWALNSARLSGPVARNMMKGWMHFRTPAVFVAWQSVCFEDVYRASTDTLINTYGYTAYTPSAVVKTICGK